MIFWPKKGSQWSIYGQFSNFKMLYLLNRWTNSVQPVDADCWNAVFFTPGYLMIYSWVIRRLFACNCWMGIILQPFMDIWSRGWWRDWCTKTNSYYAGWHWNLHYVPKIYIKNFAKRTDWFFWWDSQSNGQWNEWYRNQSKARYWESGVLRCQMPQKLWH